MSDILRKPCASDIAAARRMHADGWTITQVTAILNGRGLRVSAAAVGRWVDPERAERHVTQSRELKRRRRREARLKALADAGLLAPAIAKVMTLDFPEHPMTSWQVRWALKTGRLPKCRRGSAMPESLHA